MGGVRHAGSIDRTHDRATLDEFLGDHHGAGGLDIDHRFVVDDPSDHSSSYHPAKADIAADHGAGDYLSAPDQSAPRRSDPPARLAGNPSARS